MVGTNISQDQRNFIRNLHEQDILDNNFDNVFELRTDNPGFLIDVINVFCNDTDNTLEQLTRYLNEPVVDYSIVTNFVHQIKGACSSIGGRRMALTCRDLRFACNDKDKERCLEFLNMVRDEYQILKDNLNTISQMERTIIANESRQRRRS